MRRIAKATPKAGGAAVERRGDRGALRGDEQHRAEQHGAEGHVVGVEEVGDVRVGRPGPPDGHEQPGERGGPGERRPLVQAGRELGHADHEDEVEEQLGPRRVALDLPVAGLLQAKPRREERRPQCAHGEILAKTGNRVRAAGCCGSVESVRTASAQTRRRLTALAVACVVGAVLVVVLGRGGGGHHDDNPLGPGVVGGVAAAKPFAYQASRRADYERRAAFGLSHVLYAKSPGGVVASAARTAHYRPIVDQVARRHGLDPDMLEAIVMLESAGRADARASADLRSAVGLTQILAETGQNLLGMHIDIKASERLTRGIARGHRVRQRVALRRRVDERFDPAKAIDATARYLDFAKGKLGRDDLAIVSYHMGVGNLQRALDAYGKTRIPYAQLYFDSSPLRHARAWRILAGLGDDSATYLWRVLAAREIMRMYREDPKGLAQTAALQSHKASAEEVLHPQDDTKVYTDPDALGKARESGELRVLSARELGGHGVKVDPRMGEMAGRVGQSAALYRALRPQALAMLEAIGSATRAISGTGPLIVTSTVRDARYQRVLAAHDIEATHAYSLHTTGYAFDIARTYGSRSQALAFQFVLDRLTARGMIAWVREPGAIHVTVASR